MSNGAVEAEEELRKAGREYAWNWFEFHAKQRQQAFRFYLTLIGALLAAYYVAARLILILQSRQDVYFPTFDPCPLLISFLAIVASVLFYRLDRRNRILVRYAEDALQGIESEFTSRLGQNCLLNMVGRAADPMLNQPGYVRWLTTYGDIFRIIYLIGCLGGVLGLVASWPQQGLWSALKLFVPS